ncbi:hypothetical protein [Frigidibacter oleivorans]|uniref:hypothetical protein n=1 Tax=Frigidibacter oleivorans TaxID=2487129 RepID=UPI000F8D679B|nr:hypothetical protein [Frigidibacter oleivorans]
MSLADPFAPARRALPRPWLLRLAAIAGGLVLVALILGRILDFGIRRDEMMFVAPAALAGEMPLYSGLFFNHVPLSPWAFAAAHWLAPGLGLLMVARLTVFAAWLLLLAATGLLVQRISRSLPLALLAAVALATSDTLLDQAGMAATNNLLPLPFAMIGLGLVLVALLEDPRPGVLPATGFAAGLALALAVGLKVSAVAFLPPVLLAALLLPRRRTFGDRLRGLALPGLLGGLVGAAPILWYLATAPDLFLAHVLGFHTGPHVAYWQANAASEPGLAMDPRGKLILAYGAWLGGSTLLLAGVALAALWAGASPASTSTSASTLAPADAAGSNLLRPRPALRRPQGADGWADALALALGALAVTAAMAFLPTPGFPQYYVQPLVCLPLVAAVAMRRLTAAQARALTPAIAAALVLMVLVALPRLSAGAAGLAAPGRTEAARFAEGGRRLAEALDAAGAPAGRIATLMPLYPLEAGLPVYPEFATGPFAFRIAGHTAPDLAARYVMTGPDGLAALFAADPPAAVLLGYEPELEAPLADWARAAGYRPVPVEGLTNRYGAGVLMVRGPAG